jgi:hypothetical protein
MVLAPSEWADPRMITNWVATNHVYDLSKRPFFRGSDGFYYMICRGTAGNVLMVKRHRYNKYVAVVTVCRHPQRFDSEEACWVGQICALKSDAMDFMSRANEYTIYNRALHNEAVIRWEKHRAEVTKLTGGYLAGACNCDMCMSDRQRELARVAHYR